MNDAGTACGCWGKVVVSFVMIRKWSEVLRRRMRWRGCIDKSYVDGVKDQGWIFGWYIGA